MTSEEYGQYIDDFELGADVMPGESLTQYIERRRREFESKADGGSIGIEVLFGPKRDDFSIGGNVKKNQPYDPRASTLDYAAALDKVGAGTAEQKLKAFGDYAKNVASTGGKKVLQKLGDLTGYTQHNVNNQLLRNALEAGDINEKQYKLMGGYDVAQQFPGPQITDDAMVGLSSLLYNAVKSGINIYDPQNPYAQYGQFSAPESIGLNMQGAKGLTATDKDIYERIISGKPVKSKTPLSESDFFKQFYGVPYKGFENKFFKTVQKGDPNYDAIRAASSAGSFSDLVDRGVIQAYTGPTDYKNYLSTFADGGRVRMVSGGALKGIMNLFKRGGDDAVDLVKQEEIFREGPITTKFLEDVDDKLIKKFVRTRDTGGVGGYGMYDSFDDMPAGLKAAELISRIKKKGGEINYEAAELFLGKKLKGNESVDELIDIMLKDSPQLENPIDDFYNYVLKGEKKADGGRVGLFMGGPALEGQALSIYNSMSAYGFSDQEIANALAERGLYTPGGTTEETGIIASAPNIINQQTGGDGPPGPAPTGTKTYGKTFTGMTMPDGTPIGSSGVVEGPGIIDGLKNAATGLFDLYQKFSPFGIVSNFMKQRAEKQQEIQDNAIEKARKEREMQQAIKDAEAAQAALDNAVRTGRRPGSGSGPTTKDDGGGSAGTGGYSYDAGGREGFGYGLKEGGLATMFTRRR